MSRQPRLLLGQSYYHIITRGNNRHNVFESPEDYSYYLGLIKRFKKALPFDLYHYCLMPNHIHMQIKTKNASDFSLFMKKINLAYFYYYRKKYDWIGHFWQDRFRSQPIGKDDYFIQCGKYIELNPIRANLVSDPDKYPFSSYNYYAKGEKNYLITEDIIYSEFGNNTLERQKQYEKMIIEEAVVSNYSRKIWGSFSQQYNEIKKIRYHIDN